MIETLKAPPRMNEYNRCGEGRWLSLEDEKRFDLAFPQNAQGQNGGWVGNKPEVFDARFAGMIHIGHKVFIAGDFFLGLTTKLFLNQNGQVSHLAVRTARLLGYHKVVPIALVSEVTPFRVHLSITREQFKDLPGYQSDSNIAEDVDRALWKDIVLRDTDYHEIDFQVRDGMITLNGHVGTSMNQWRAETAVKNIPGIMGVSSYLIPDDRLTLQVAEALGQIEQATGSKFFTKIENGVVVLVGEVSSTALRDQAEQRVAEIPWVRGVINEICVPSIGIDFQEQPFLQPLIGGELLFKDGHSVTIQKVVINPHNRRVEAMVVLGRFPDPLRQEPDAKYRENSGPARLVVLPAALILYLTRSAGFIRITSAETTEYAVYDPAQYTTPNAKWLPPYPYCTDKVLFQAEKAEIYEPKFHQEV